MKKSVKFGLAVAGTLALLAAVTPNENTQQEKKESEVQEILNQAEEQPQYKGTLNDLKKYAAKYLNCKPEYIMVYAKKETAQSIEVDCALKGSQEKHLVVYDYNTEGPMGITIDKEYFFIKDGKLTKNWK